MRRLIVAVTAVVMRAAPLLSRVSYAAIAAGAVGIWLTVRGPHLIEKVAVDKVVVCYGIGCRGAGGDPVIQGLRSPCWDMIPYGGPVCSIPVHAEPSVSGWWLDNPKGDPSVSLKRTGQGAVPAVY